MLSVCMLSFNHEEYVEEALQGALMQETDFPYEVVVHDDASTDSTQAILRAWQARYPDRLRLILQTENKWSQGILPLTKYVIPTLPSRYIAFCECDDFWTDPTKLQRQVDLLEANPALTFSAHDIDVIFEDGVPRKERFYPVPRQGDFTFTFADAFDNHFVASPSIVVRTHLWQNRPPNPHSMVSGDIQSILWFLANGPAHYSSRKMVVKRRNRGGITFNKQYNATRGEGAYENLHYIAQFAPADQQVRIKHKMAEYERMFVSKGKRTRRASITTLAVRAFLHDPFWFLRRLSGTRLSPHL